MLERLLVSSRHMEAYSYGPAIVCSAAARGPVGLCAGQALSSSNRCGSLVRLIDKALRAKGRLVDKRWPWGKKFLYWGF